MEIRRIKKEDCQKVIELLNEVLEIHARIRPDIFVSGTTKYLVEDLYKRIDDDKNPIYVADDNGVVGYAFCMIKEPPFSNNMVYHKEMFIDDLCVDSNVRSSGVGRALFEHVKTEAKKIGCYEVTLNVWEGNDNAIAFYKKMGLKPKEYYMEYILND